MQAVDSRRLLHELQVHQIELEMQNEELQKARDEMEAGLTKYSELYDFAPVGYLTLSRDGVIRESNLAGARLLGVARSALMKQRFNAYVLPADRSIFDKFIQQVFEGSVTKECEVRLLPCGKTQCDVRIRGNLSDSRVLCQLAMGDVTESKLAERALKTSEERFRILFELGPTAIYSCDASGLIRNFNSCAVELWGRRPASGEKNDRFCGSFKLFRPDGSFMGRAECPMADVLNGKLAEARDQEVIIERPDASRLTCIVNIRPIKNERGEITGAINCFYDITERRAKEEARRRLEVLTASNSKLNQEIVRRQAIEATLRKNERRALRMTEESLKMQQRMRHFSHQILQVQEKQRKEISRELHDKVGQLLVGINIHLAAFAETASKNPHGIHRTLVPMRRLVEKSLKIVHQFARELRPASLDDLGLIPALRTYIKDFPKRKGRQIHFVAVAGVEAMDNDKRTVLYRVAQEALTNVDKHSEATFVKVVIAEAPGGICLEITDNGRAFNVDRLASGQWGRRLGLIGMRERVEMVGGHFSVLSASGQGTTIRAEIPFGL